MTTAFVLTTINKPTVIGQFLDNCRQHGHTDVEFIVVGDLVSHPETEAFIGKLNADGGKALYLSPLEQEKLLRKCPEFCRTLPYNTVQRRNIGYLFAYERGHERIISIDDDNFPLEDTDFVGCHNIVGSEIEIETIASDNGWFNSCSLTVTNPERRYYHRGYPANLRWRDGTMSRTKRKARIVANVGLWQGDPDVDTVTRLEEPFSVTAIHDQPLQLGVAAGTLFPYNSQNTAFHRDLIPTMYLIAMPDNGLIDHVGGSLNFRYDDIWMSYFQKIAIDHMGDQICVGPPHVRQDRNPHNHLHDLRRELIPMEITAKLADVFPKFVLGADSYGETYREIAENIRVHALYNHAFYARERQILGQTVDGMMLWLDAVRSFS